MQYQPNLEPRNGQLRQLSIWTRRYAENRTFPNLIIFLIFLLLNCGYIGIPFLLGYAYRVHQWLVFTAGVVLLVVLIVANIWFAVPRWGGQWVGRLTARLYHHEGQMALKERPLLKQMVQAAVAILLIGISVEIILGLLGILPGRLMQPISAIYMAPVLIVLTWSLGGDYFTWGYLWALMYALHAILIMIGAPIYFTGQYTILNMQIPTIGYGLLSALIGYVYSRIALAKIRRLAKKTLEGGLHG